jgi:hypothetical protein
VQPVHDHRREEEPLFAGLFGIFGHGNVTCISEALEAVQDKLPTWRGQNEQSMALAAVGYAKAMRRRQIMIALSSIGPGALNMVTAAGCAHANRLPILILAGDVFANRRPDPVLQQVEHFTNPTVSVNDAFKAVTRYWDRITHPEQIISSLPQAVATMLDPGDCGPLHRPLPGHAGAGLRLPGSLLRTHRAHDPAAQARPRARGEGGRAHQGCEAAADHFGRWRPLFGCREGRRRIRAEARRADGRDDRRKGCRRMTTRRMWVRSASSARRPPTRWPVRRT